VFLEYCKLVLELSLLAYDGSFFLLQIIDVVLQTFYRLLHLAHCLLRGV